MVESNLQFSRPFEPVRDAPLETQELTALPTGPHLSSYFLSSDNPTFSFRLSSPKGGGDFYQQLPLVIP